MTEPLRWVHSIAEIGETGIEETRVATPAELKAMAEALEILACESLSAHYRIVPLGQDRFRLAGEVSADVTQACVITLDPVAAHVTDSFSVEYRPAEDAGVPRGEQSVLEGDDIEPLAGHSIDAGRIVFEVLSASLDPYPRKPGAELAWQDDGAGHDGAPEGPFAPLAKLKPPK